MTDLHTTDMAMHEDDRRIIYDWAAGEFKSAKAVVVKQAIPIGDHYHKNKEETFLLLQGKFMELVVGDDKRKDIPAPFVVFVPKGVYHKFICEPGSILLGVATELFDINDEIRC